MYLMIHNNKAKMSAKACCKVNSVFVETEQNKIKTQNNQTGYKSITKKRFEQAAQVK